MTYSTPPWEPPLAGTEAEHLVGALERLRTTFRWKADDLDAAGLRTRVGASALTLGGLLKHLARAEEQMFSTKLSGAPLGPPWDVEDWDTDTTWDFDSAAADSPEQLYAIWDDTIERSRVRLSAALAGGGLDQLVHLSWDGRQLSLRRLVCDLIEEYGRHTGHADLLREAVDGRVGEDPPAGWQPRSGSGVKATTEFREQDLAGARFEDVNLRGATFARVYLNDAHIRDVDLSGAQIRGTSFIGCRMRGVELDDVEIHGALNNVVVNGVDIAPLVEAELDRRMPERATMRPDDADGFREAWATLERLWEGTVVRARTLPEAALHRSVDDEWSFIQTLRHLNFASAAWVGRMILGTASPWHPLDLPWDKAPGWDGIPWDREARPSLDEVLAVRRERQAMVRGVVESLTDEQLASEVTLTEPGWPRLDAFPVKDCLRIVLNEEWEHRLYAERDLTSLEQAD